jgi:phosphoribosylformylglycinamidine synthase
MKVLILKAPGTNRDFDVQGALGRAGAVADILPLSGLRSAPGSMRDYGMLVIPGGFSYGDALGAGKLFALDLSRFFADEVRRFVEEGRPVLGICNGFRRF